MLTGRHGRKQCEEKDTRPFTFPAFKACFVLDVHLLPLQEEACLSELSDTAFPLSTSIFLILTSTSCLSRGKSRLVTRAQWVNCFSGIRKMTCGTTASRTWKITERKATQSMTNRTTALSQASVKQRP